LDKNHVVFGYVIEGMDVVDAIHHAPRDGESPKEKVRIVDSGEVSL